MDLSVQSRPQISDSHFHIPVEEQSRLSRHVHAQTGIGRLTQREQQIVLRNVAQGLKQLVALNGNAADWANAFEQMAASGTDMSVLAASDGQHIPPHPILQVLIEQPAPSRTPEQRKRCLAIGAHAFMAIVFGLRRTPSQFPDRLRQLFRSDKDGWLELCAQDFLSVQLLQAWTPATTVAVVREFRSNLIDLHETGIPAAAGYLTPRQRSLSPTPEPSVGSEPAEQPKKNPKEKPPDNITERFDLFPLQKQRDCQQDVVDGYRLPVHWARLHPDELRPLLRKLADDLRNRGTDMTSRQRRAHAAARLVSLFAGMSLKKCLRLPLRRRGSMKLDIRQGVIRRDVLIVAPRTDRKDRNRLHGRWWRTRLPKEVTQALQEFWADHPEARTLGEILHATGLNHEACQALLNDDWPSSHRPEDTRFSMSLRPALLALDIHPALVSRVSGDTMVTPASDHYYLSFSESQVHQAVAIFCIWAGLTPPDAPVRDRQIGTPKALAQSEFREAMTKLNQMVMKARNEITPKSSISQILEFHNLYTCAVALQIIWGIGGRGDRIPALTFERLFASQDYLAVSDRRVDRYSRQRIVPATKVLTATRCHYLEHLRSVADSLERACERSNGFVAKVAAGGRPHDCAFFIYEQTPQGWIPRTLQRQDLVTLAGKLGVGELNAARHFWFNALLDRNVAQVGIEAFLGHHLNGSEAFGYSSGVSVREVSEYLHPIMTDVQDALGFKPLVGRGRQADRYLALPDLLAKRTLRPLPSVLLKRKLAAQDLLIKDVGMYEQDPPSTAKTLLAHSQLTLLKRRYLESDVVGRHPVGALLFCLIAMELVLTPPEQEALLAAALADGMWLVGELVVIEATSDDRPVAQRLAGDHTVAAASLARRAHEQSPSVFARAQLTMHRLLMTLDPSWPGRDAEDSARLLAMLASHWAAVEIPPGSLFIALHKAPFIPAKDLARIYYQRACRPALMEERAPRPRQWSIRTADDPTHQILKRWADKDAPLGEEGARRKGCLTALKTRRGETELDEAELLRIDLLCADLQPDAPYRTLSPTVLPDYDRGYRIYFDFVRREGTPEVDPETFLEAYATLGGGRDFTLSCPARWQMLHICAFLKTRGHWVPPGFLETQSQKVATWPRLPVYTTQAEIAASRRWIEQHFEGRGGTFAFAGFRLSLQRSVPMRVSEPRYSRPSDFDPKAGLFHITTTGHDHLKSERSRGSVLLSEPLALEMNQLRERRRAIDVGADTLLFADAHLKATYAAFNAVSDAMRDSVILATGCPQFRQHDLRAAAATDRAFAVEREVMRLCRGEAVVCEPATAESVSQKHGRFAWAARQARHGSVLTTLRYYNCAGVLDLRHHLDLAGAGSALSGKYAASLLGKPPQALYAAAHRARKSAVRVSDGGPAVFRSLLNDLLSGARQLLPTPILGAPIASWTHIPPASSPRSNGTTLLEAVLMCALGMTESAAADATQLPTPLVVEAQGRLKQRSLELGIRMSRLDQTPLTVSRLGGEDLPIANVVHRYAKWLASSKAPLQRAALPLAAAIDRSGSRLLVHSESQFLELLPVIRAMDLVGFSVTFRLGPDRLLHQFPQLESALRDSAFEIHPINSKEAVFATLGFLFADSMPTAKERAGGSTKPNSGHLPLGVRASPRHFGRAGRLAVAGLILGLLH